MLKCLSWFNRPNILRRIEMKIDAQSTILKVIIKEDIRSLTLEVRRMANELADLTAAVVALTEASTALSTEVAEEVTSITSGITEIQVILDKLATTGDPTGDIARATVQIKAITESMTQSTTNLDAAGKALDAKVAEAETPPTPPVEG